MIVEIARQRGELLRTVLQEGVQVLVQLQLGIACYDLQLEAYGLELLALDEAYEAGN